MSRAGPTLAPALAAIAIGGVVLFFADPTWLRTGSALLMIVGIALGFRAIATPEVLERDRDEGPS